MRRGALIVLSGPAGSGKTTLCDRLVAAHPSTLGRVVTCTTRQAREGEVDGVDYHFLSTETFEAQLVAGAFLEHARVHGRIYGLRAAEVVGLLDAGKDALLNVDIQGAATLRARCAADAALAAALVTVFIRVADPVELRRRLAGRATDAPDEIERRLKVAVEEMAHVGEYDHVIESGTRDADFARLDAIYRAVRGA